MTHTTVPVIFDLDGTLVDPARGISDGITTALSALGLAVPGQDRLDAMIGPELRHSMLDIAGVPAGHLEEAIRIYRDYYSSTGIAQGRLYPGIRDLLAEYVEAGRPVAVATQKPEGLARIVLEHHGIASFFQSIRGSAANEAARTVGPPGKIGIVAAALADLAARSSVDAGAAVMVGDRAQDVAGAAANGLDCIGVGWGFALDGELHAAGAAAIVHNTRDLRDTIGRLDHVRTAALTTNALNEVPTDGNV
ncbi:HAD hydrolase-like protein [Arthrobacter oryzae]|uniref:HAD family hydrolase n=1 Tax=Arthrobacter oryzae TaxID=409290 RepID=A0A3N0C5V0_9MICC|nr:HAD hydrolase-like protein [Arthrobacter oryzae]RNL58314.1 HAD family hydrolase [Arthrobacter oryzae]